MRNTFRRGLLGFSFFDFTGKKWEKKTRGNATKQPSGSGWCSGVWECLVFRDDLAHVWNASGLMARNRAIPCIGI